MTEAKPDLARGWAPALLAAVVLLGVSLRLRGVAWPALHPDEPKIAGWVEWIGEHTRTQDPAYPGGYFHLLKPLMLLREGLGERAREWRSFEGRPEGAPEARSDLVVLLRRINVGMAALTILLLYALAARISGSRAGGLAAATLLAVSPLHVEHSHYAETDIAMLLTLVLALYAWARVHTRGGRVGVLVAAAATGLAIGTKYTNGFLVFPLLSGLVVATAAAAPGRRFRRGVLLAAGGLVGLALGFLYTNRHILDGAVFWSHLGRGLDSVYAERAGILNQSADRPHAALVTNLNTFKAGLAGLGWGWGLLAALGLVRVWARPYRRYWPVVLLFAAGYTVYFLFLAPWTRGQEFLAFLPVAAMTAAIGVREGLAAGRRLGRPVVAALVVTALALVATVETGLPARRMAGLFGWPEPRVQAMRWLYTHAPLDASVGVESYTIPVLRLFDKAVDIGQIEWVAPARFRTLGLDYLARNAASQGRGTVDPFTGALYPDYAANLAAFRADARWLAAWGPASDRRVAFAGHRFEWWAARPAAGAVSLATPLFGPVTVEDGLTVCVPQLAPGVGSVPGMLVDARERRFVVSGGGEGDRALYVVLQTEERGARVHVRMTGVSRTVAMGPYDAVAVPVRRPGWAPRLDDVDIVSVRAEEVFHVQRIPCYAQVATSAAGAAALLLQKGHADRAWELLRGDTREDGTWPAFVAAAEAGDGVAAHRLLPAARAALARFEEAAGVEAGRLSVNGCGGQALREHRRLRLPLAGISSDGLRLRLETPQFDLARADRTNLYTSTWALPVRLAPGEYEIHGRLRVKPPVTLQQPWRLVFSEAGQAGEAFTLEPGREFPLRQRLVVTRERELALTLSSTQPGALLELGETEIRWGQGDPFAGERAVLGRAIREVEAARDRPPAEAGDAGGRAVFYPWLKLNGATVKGGRCRLEFEILRDAPPPLRLVAYRERRRGPARFHEAALTPRAPAKGERVTTSFALPAGAGLDALSIRIMADGVWKPTPLRITGQDEDRLRLGRDAGCRIQDAG
jgi:4-amino-4-deoxy-L-arabinose transferase-like glycosyltransferase